MPVSPAADHTSHASMFSTRLFMPGWWVRAFDTATQLPKDTTMHAIDVARKMQVLPALDLAELNALAAIIGEMQEQLLLRGDTTMRIDPSQFEKHASTTNRSRVFAFAKVLQWLPALRLLKDTGKQVEATPLFVQEAWVKEGDDLTLEVRLHELGSELLLGYTCSHLDMLRKATGKPLAQVLIGDQPPLSFWRSAWMELQGAEQAFLVRLEKAMQWESCWLHFDGIFGKKLSELIEGLDIRLPKRQIEVRQTKLAQIQWLLDRVGKKLFHQGLLRFDVENEYLAFNELHDRGTLLVWQVTSQKVAMEEVGQYQKECMGFLHKYLLFDKLDPLVRTLCPEGEREELLRIGRQLIAEAAPELLEPISHGASAAPVLPMPAFLEWRARQLPGHPLPLPADLLDSEPAKLSRCEPEEVVMSSILFARSIRASLDLRTSFQLIPETTISQVSAWSKPSVAAYLSTVNKDASILAPSPVPLKNEIDRPQTDAPKPLVNQKLAPVKQSINLRRLANEELNKLRQHEPARYLELKQTYLNSLDEGRRNLILDLQGRVSPEHFDNHLRGSLVRYMIENPSVWKSAKAPQQHAPSRH